MGTVGAEYEICIRDVAGEVVNQIVEDSDSFVANFTKLLEAGMKDANVSVVDLYGTPRLCGNFSCSTKNDVGGVVTRGILVGRGTAAVAAGDHSLAIQIPTQVLSYQPCVVPPDVPVVSDGMIRCRIIRRTFVNVSTAPVEISEVGIAALASGYPILILRDVLSESVTVPVGGVVDISYTFKSAVDKGFVANYMIALACSFYGGAEIPVVDTDGVSRNVNFIGKFPTNATTAQDHFGIQVGMSNAGPVGNEYKLDVPITHGAGVGQLQYGAVSVDPTVVGDGIIEFKVARGFINETSNPITIREVGLVARCSGYNILLERNVIEPVEIPPYDGVNVTITHRTEI